MLQIASTLAIAACDAIVDLIDEGSGTAKLIVYDGEKPADLQTAITNQTALVTFDLPNPAFGNAVDDTEGAIATANAISDATADEDGEATFFRILDADGTPIIQGDVSQTGGGGDLELSSVNIVTGVDVTVVSLTAIMPKS